MGGGGEEEGGRKKEYLKTENLRNMGRKMNNQIVTPGELRHLKINICVNKIVMSQILDSLDSSEGKLAHLTHGSSPIQ